MLVTEMGTVWCWLVGWSVTGTGLDWCPAGGWRRVAGELYDLGLDLMWKDPGLRPVAQTRTKTGLT